MKTQAKMAAKAAVGLVLGSLAGCATLNPGSGEGVYGSTPAYEQTLSPAEQNIRSSLYTSILIQALASKANAGHGSGTENIGALNTYRRTPSPKAFSACIFWDSATASRVRIDRWQFIHEDPNPKVDAIRRCQPHERPGCRCQIVDIGDRNKLYVPPAVLHRLTGQ